MFDHLSGLEIPVEGDGTSLVFESIHLTTMVVTPIPLSGDLFANGNGLAYDAVAGDFVVSAVVTQVPDGGALALLRLSTTGVATAVGLMTHDAGGRAFSDSVPVELQSFTID